VRGDIAAIDEETTPMSSGEDQPANAYGRSAAFGHRFRQVFPARRKPLIAMAHIGALPGAPLHDETVGIAGIVGQLQRDIDILVESGFDAVMFCNENDRPYQLKADLVAAAVMSRVVAECLPLQVPFGVDYLWDAQCALAVAIATEASFLREVVTGVWESDMGLWAPDAASVLRRRREYGAESLAVLMNITPEFASPVGRRSPAEVARTVSVSSLPDALLVSGPMAGAEPELSTVAEVRSAVDPALPVLLNTGANPGNIADFLGVADGCVVGSALKVDGYTWNQVDPSRAGAFVRAARGG
jgi:membrane complex biogenesis BtpA family protein